MALRRRGVLTATGPLLAAVGLAGAWNAAAASDWWCEVDPPVQIQTPAGNTVVVFVLDAAPDGYREFIKRPSIAYSVAPTKGGRTQVCLEVVIPTAGSGVEPFPVRSRVWDGRGSGGVMLSERVGVAGEVLRHTFLLGTA